MSFQEAFRLYEEARKQAVVNLNKAIQDWMAECGVTAQNVKEYHLTHVLGGDVRELHRNGEFVASKKFTIKYVVDGQEYPVRQNVTAVHENL